MPVLHQYMGYKGLSNEEMLFVLGFFDNNLTEMTKDIDKLLLSDKPLSKDMRRFIADVFTGRLTTKKMGRPPNTRRDKWIHMQVEELHLKQGMSLTSDRDGNDAVAKVAGSMSLSEDVVLKAYQKIENGDPRLEKGEGYNDPAHYVRITMCDDNGVIKYDLIGDIL